jgi:hypothetical protein
MPLCCKGGSQSMKQVIIAFLHYLLNVFQALQKVGGRGNLFIELCPALKAGFLLGT